MISTIHAAKGLEWKNVFIYNVNDGSIPFYRSIDSPEAIEEERRVLFVGITRAKGKRENKGHSIFSCLSLTQCFRTTLSFKIKIFESLGSGRYTNFSISDTKCAGTAGPYCSKEKYQGQQ